MQGKWYSGTYRDMSQEGLTLKVSTTPFGNAPSKHPAAMLWVTKVHGESRGSAETNSPQPSPCQEPAPTVSHPSPGTRHELMKLQMIQTLDHPVFKLFQLRSQTSQNKHKLSPLCPFQIPDTQNPYWLLLYAYLSPFELLYQNTTETWVSYK